MVKKLTFKDIEKENKLYEKKKKVTLSDEFYVNIYPNFSPIKISEVIRETLTDPQIALDAGIDFSKINLGDWQLFNIICKFTDLGIPSDDIQKKVQAFIEVMNSEYWTKIIASFPKESLNKLDESFDRFKENLDLMLKNGSVDVENILKVVEEK
jgi:hypothetical protein